MSRGLTEDEESLLTVWTRFGSDGYPIHKLTGGRNVRRPAWIWYYRSIAGPPTVFKTRREAVKSFEAFIDVLLDAKAGRI